jgi:hypothetical protein
MNSNKDSHKRYTKNVVSDELWKTMRLETLKRGITIAQWINEAFQEKLEHSQETRNVR